MTVLCELLDQVPRFSPEFGHGLSNHLPMTLIALDGLDASEEEMRSFFESYVPRLGIGAGELGDAEASAYFDALAQNKERIWRDGRGALLTHALSLLGPGIGAAAFHGMLRTAYGITADADLEVAAGLAYWKLRDLSLYPTRPAAGNMALASWLQRLRQTPQLPLKDRWLIFQHMADLAAQPAFQEQLAGLDPASISLDQLANIAAGIYLQNQNFTVLHLITSAQALRLLLPFAQDKKALLHDYAVAFGVALALAASGPDRAPIEVEVVAFEEIQARARRSNNDHTIKLVYSCKTLLTLAEQPGSELEPALFQRTASLAVRNRAAAF